MKISVIGGDNRNTTLAKILAENGFNVMVYDDNKLKLEEVLEGADKIVLGIPFTKDNETLFGTNKVSIEYFCNLLKKGQMVYGGVFTDYFLSKINSKDAKYMDFMNDEGFAILNTIPTVEGAIELAIKNTDITIHNSKVLVIGYGRIGKLLSKVLKDMGAQVFVSARKNEDFAWIKTLGFNKQEYSNLISEIGKYDIIFNTVPHLILNSDLIDMIDEKSLVIDLASKPGGVDFDYANHRGINVIWALGLPGKVAYITAARYMYDVIMNNSL